MSEPHQIYFDMAPTFGGDPESVEGWANSPDSEIVANLFQNHFEPHGPEWVLSHRRSGRKINNLMFETKRKALAFASMIEGFDGFKKIVVTKIGALPEWGEVDPVSLQASIEKEYEKFRSEEARALADLVYG